jgi:two-component system heavy metal sensor histidine kinase CusS
VEPELKRITEYFEGVADENGITLDVAASGTLVADPILFRRAVSNLVANAIRHSPSGARILVRGHEQHSDNFLVSVANPGSGIPPEQLPKIFDRFYRVDDSRRDSQFSSGLGLAIVKSIMTLHGGTVGVKSEPGGLTTFSLVFPSG